MNRAVAQRALAHQRIDRIDERDVAAGDRRRARAAVGLQHVAIDRDRALAERLQIDHRAQRAADEPLNLQRAPALLAGRRFTPAARVRRARQHAVLGRDPAAAGVAQERGHVSSTLAVHSTRVSPNSIEHRAFGMPGETAGDAHRPQLIGSAAAGSGFHGCSCMDGAG